MMNNKPYTIIECWRCGWSSEPLSQYDLRLMGVPWYCDRCGERVTSFVSGTLDELRREYPNMIYEVRNEANTSISTASDQAAHDATTEEEKVRRLGD